VPRHLHCRDVLALVCSVTNDLADLRLNVELDLGAQLDCFDVADSLSQPVDARKDSVAQAVFSLVAKEPTPNVDLAVAASSEDYLGQGNNTSNGNGNRNGADSGCESDFVPYSKKRTNCAILLLGQARSIVFRDQVTSELFEQE